MDMTPQFERQLRQIIREEIKCLRDDIARIRQELFKSSTNQPWVTAGEIKKLTGWTDRDMERHRNQGTIEFKYLTKGEDGKKSAIRYNLNSIPEQYLNRVR